MQRRAFVRTGLAAALLAPASLSFSTCTRAVPTAAPRRRLASDVVRLSSNENPLGLPQSARRAIIDMLSEGHRYPRLNRDVVARLALKHAVAPNNIVLGNGSAEILQMTVQAMAVGNPRVRVVIPDPTFEQV